MKDVTIEFIQEQKEIVEMNTKLSFMHKEVKWLEKLLDIMTFEELRKQIASNIYQLREEIKDLRPRINNPIESNDEMEQGEGGTEQHGE